MVAGFAFVINARTLAYAITKLRIYFYKLLRQERQEVNERQQILLIILSLIVCEGITMKMKTAPSKARALHQASIGLTLFFELLILFEVFLEAFLVFLQIGAESSLPAPRLVLGRLAFVSMLIVMVVVIEDLLKKGLLVFGGLLSIYHRISA
jgi:hypothetical protein